MKIWFQNHRYKLKKYVKECDNTTSSPSPPHANLKKHSSQKPPFLLADYRHSENPPHLSPPLRSFKRSVSSSSTITSRHHSTSPDEPYRPTMYPFTKSYPDRRRQDNYSPPGQVSDLHEFRYLSSSLQVPADSRSIIKERAGRGLSRPFRYTTSMPAPPCSCSECDKRYTSPPLSLSIDQWKESDNNEDLKTPSSSIKREIEEQEVTKEIKDEV